MPFDAVLLLRFFHLFFAFTYVGALVVAEWNGRAARRSADWRERAALHRVTFMSLTVAGIGGLLLLGVIGNVLSTMLGYRMGADTWMRWVNGLWVAAVLVMLLLSVPAAGALARLAKQAADSGTQDTPTGYAATLTRWRIAGLVQSALYLALLALMVFRWRG